MWTSGTAATTASSSTESKLSHNPHIKITIGKKDNGFGVDHTGTLVVNDLKGFTEQLEKSTAFMALSGAVIDKVKIKDRTLTITYSEMDQNDSGVETVKKCDALAHDDLINVFAKLRLHLAHICELRESKLAMKDANYYHEDLIKLNVTGFTISGTGEAEGVVLIGNRETAVGTLNLVTPFIQWETTSYQHSSELAEVLDQCKYEVKLYLAGKAAVKQLSMFEDQVDGQGEEHEEAA